MAATPPDARLVRWIERLFGHRIRESTVKSHTNGPADNPVGNGQPTATRPADEINLPLAQSRDDRQAEATTVSPGEHDGLNDTPFAASPVGETLPEAACLEEPCPPSESDSHSTGSTDATRITEEALGDGEEDNAPHQAEDQEQDPLPCLDPFNEWYRVFLTPGTVLVRFSANPADAPQVIPFDPELWKSLRGSAPGYVRRQ